MSTEPHTKVRDALDHVRAAAQDLYVAISDTAARQAATTKADLEVIAQKTKAVTESLKGSVGPQNEAAKQHLAEAASHLAATQKHVAEAVKASGDAVQTAVRQALAAARASVEQVSTAVAAKRSAESTKTH